jgi:hypothetical protein
MKSYKVRFTDGKTIMVHSVDKITSKKLSSNFLSFDGSADDVSKIHVNTKHVVTIEEQKALKGTKEMKSQESGENKGQVIK